MFVGNYERVGCGENELYRRGKNTRVLYVLVEYELRAANDNKRREPVIYFSLAVFVENCYEPDAYDTVENCGSNFEYTTYHTLTTLLLQNSRYAVLNPLYFLILTGNLVPSVIIIS